MEPGDLRGCSTISHSSFTFKHLDLWDAPDVETNAVLSITNNVSLTSDEVGEG